MKDFDLKKAMNGAKVCCANGSEAEIIYISPSSPMKSPAIVAIIEKDGRKQSQDYFSNGQVPGDATGIYDLKMATVKRGGWMAICKNSHTGGAPAYFPIGFYETEEIAIEEVGSSFEFVMATYFEWEEEQ